MYTLTGISCIDETSTLTSSSFMLETGTGSTSSRGSVLGIAAKGGGPNASSGPISGSSFTWFERNKERSKYDEGNGADSRAVRQVCYGLPKICIKLSYI